MRIIIKQCIIAADLQKGFNCSFSQIQIEYFIKKRKQNVWLRCEPIDTYTKVVNGFNILCVYFQTKRRKINSEKYICIVYIYKKNRIPLLVRNVKFLPHLK